MISKTCLREGRPPERVTQRGLNSCASGKVKLCYRPLRRPRPGRRWGFQVPTLPDVGQNKVTERAPQKMKEFGGDPHLLWHGRDLIFIQEDTLTTCRPRS